MCPQLLMIKDKSSLYFVNKYKRIFVTINKKHIIHKCLIISYLLHDAFYPTSDAFYPIFPSTGENASPIMNANNSKTTHRSKSIFEMIKVSIIVFHMIPLVRLYSVHGICERQLFFSDASYPSLPYAKKNSIVHYL